MRPPAGWPMARSGRSRPSLPQRPRLTREGALLLSLVALDVALINHAGYVSDLSLPALGASFGGLLIARMLPSGPPPTWLWATVVASLGASLLLAHFADWPQGWPMWIYVVAALAASVLVMMGRNRAALLTGLLGGLVFLSVCWRWDPSQIDVLYGLRSAGHALLHGQNPYLPVHPSTTLGSPALVHFTYGPVVAALAAVGLLFGDPRVISALAVLALAAALFRLAGSRTTGWQLAVTVTVTPLMIAMVINAWPILIATAAIAWWLVLRRQHRAVAVLLLGLAVGCALVPVGPLMLVLFLRSRRFMREILVASGLGVIIVGAFAWWTGFANYWYYTIGIHFHGVVGKGSLSLAGILALIGKHPLPGFLGIAVGALVLAWVVARPVPGLGGILTDAAMVTLFAMFFAKFAFIDYYFIAFAAIWLAIAAASAPVEEDLVRAIKVKEPVAVPAASAPAPAPVTAPL